MAWRWELLLDTRVAQAPWGSAVRSCQCQALLSQGKGERQLGQEPEAAVALALTGDLAEMLQLARLGEGQTQSAGESGITSPCCSPVTASRALSGSQHQALTHRRAKHHCGFDVGSGLAPGRSPHLVPLISGQEAEAGGRGQPEERAEACSSSMAAFSAHSSGDAARYPACR